MIGIKKIDRLVTQGFIGPYLLSFFVAEFVLIMQFLWKYIDKIIGKGISFFQIMELLFFMAVKLIPMAIPLTILISAVMVFGNMAEKYELSSIKSAGVSLLRTMRPGLYIAIGTAFFSLVCSNFLVPRANFEFQSRFERIKRTKPTLTFEEGIFSDEFKGFSIKIGKKDKDGNKIGDIIIEDHTDPDKSFVNVTVAEKGEMFTTSDGNYFVMNLENGEQYKDLKSKVGESKGKNSKKKDDKKDTKSYPFMRTRFETWTKVFEMSGFSFNENLFELNRNKYDLLNSIQLYEGIDSIDKKIYRKINSNHIFIANSPTKSKKSNKSPKQITKKNVQSFTEKKVKIKKDSLTAVAPPKTKSNLKNKKSRKSKPKKNRDHILNKRRSSQIEDVDFTEVDNILASFIAEDRAKLLKNSKTRIKFVKDKVKRSQASLKAYNRERNRYVYKLNEAYSWALVCVIFLFIGAPLGSIIRKGGYGYPLLFAIVFYMLFMIMVIFGQKLLTSNTINPILAAWLPCMILIPISVLLTYKALNDSNMNSIETISKLFKRFSKKETV